MLFDPNVHEPLIDDLWDAAEMRDAIRVIARDAEDALTDDWWPPHPLDIETGDPEVWHGVYLGAAGVITALDELARLHDPRLDHAGLADRIYESYQARPEFPDNRSSLFIGEAGIALCNYQFNPTPALADRLFELAAIPEDDTLELMWGSPGGLLVADAMLTATNDPRWDAKWRELKDHLLALHGEHVPGFWTQHLYGNTGEHIGPAHGMVGVVAALARREPIDVTEAIARTAVREGPHANWPAALHEGLVHHSGTIRTQWCHGAPGVVASLASDDELLIAGGELTWTAGPLKKGAGLCHGTAGNGFALLKLFTRTNDEMWLDRARSFATHAAAQVAASRQEHGRGRYTLWTGDLGTAVYLQQCLAGTSQIPTIDTP